MTIAPISPTSRTFKTSTSVPLAHQAAADLLWRTWRSGAAIDNLPDHCKPVDRAQGYAVQALQEARSAQPLVGWKIAATSVAGQQHINVSGPIAGRLLAERVHVQGAQAAGVQAQGAALKLTGNRMRVAEPEFVFRMGQRLEPRATAFTLDEVMDAVADLHLGIELPDSRFANFVTAGEPQLIADNACAHEFILGPQAPALWRSLDLSQHAVRATVQSAVRSFTRDGSGVNVLGDPRTALTWLANELRSLGITLGQGQVVTTGTCMQPLELQAGDTVETDFGVLGRMLVRFMA
jgi:2-keto-4-pentenoate hydratase